MSNKIDVSKKQFESYKRNHSGSDFREKEVNKIEKEKINVCQLEKEIKKSLKNTNASDDDMEKLYAITYEAKKIKGNMKSHKKRYKSLSKLKDF